MYVCVSMCANFMHALSSKSDCQSDVCSPLSEGGEGKKEGEQKESSGSVRETKIRKKFKRL